jgi:hypothetical protein
MSHARTGRAAELSRTEITRPPPHRQRLPPSTAVSGMDRARPATVRRRACRAPWIHGVKDGQAIDIRHAANDDRIGEILDLALCLDERRPRGQTWAVWIARLCEVDPVAGHFASQFPISRGPLPGRLVQVVEDVPELGEVARAPTRVHGSDWERRLLSKRVVKNRMVAGSGL